MSKFERKFVAGDEGTEEIELTDKEKEELNKLSGEGRRKKLLALRKERKFIAGENGEITVEEGDWKLKKI